MRAFSISDRKLGDGNVKICVPVTGPVAVVPDLYEFRADLCEENPLSALRALKEAGQAPVIVTDRGGDYGFWIRTGLCDAIDVDIRDRVDPAGEDVVRLAREAGIPVIVSWHDHEKTPEDLETIMEELHAAGADAVKLACFANSESDVNRIMSTDADIAIAMGPLGIRSRREAKMLNYQSAGLVTAPGQEKFTGL